ncbi:hypothetical protein Prudu_365S000100, partial [Prunus dulcis]
AYTAHQYLEATGRNKGPFIFIGKRKRTKWSSFSSNHFPPVPVSKLSGTCSPNLVTLMPIRLMIIYHQFCTSLFGRVEYYAQLA